MTVPYGDTSLTQRRKNAFDVGEYGLGMCANALELGCDCLGEIYYFDSTVISAQGDLDPRNNAICLHEEDAGILWKHYDQRTDKTEVRRSRRLVISCIATIGNYEYGFFWYFYQDGSIELEVKATGIVQTGALHDGETNRHGVKLGPNLYAPHHQHFFCVRLDPTIDGIENRVTEVNTRCRPFGSDQPLRQCLLPRPHHLRHRAGRHSRPQPRDRPLLAHREFHHHECDRRNTRLPARSGRELQALRPARVIHLVPSRVHVSPPLGDAMVRRGEVPAGTFPNQSPGDDGLAVWTAADRNIRDTDVVVWYTLGHHHVVRPEDWPVMPVARMGFALKPSGFFTQNPALDVPVATSSGHCAGHC